MKKWKIKKEYSKEEEGTNFRNGEEREVYEKEYIQRRARVNKGS